MFASAVQLIVAIFELFVAIFVVWQPSEHVLLILKLEFIKILDFLLVRLMVMKYCSKLSEFLTLFSQPFSPISPCPQQLIIIFDYILHVE